MLMKKLLPLSSLALIIALGGCFGGKSCTDCTTDKTEAVAPAEHKEADNRLVDAISAEDLKHKIEHNGHHMVVINVLDENHFNDSHIKGSINIPLEHLKEKAAHLDKHKEYVVYCANIECPLSSEAFHILKDHEFKVHAYEGGMKEWKEKGFPAEGGVEHEDHQK